jgi:hypothetical protein
MKKMMSMAAMLALMLVAAAPAFADTTEGGDVEFEGSDQTQIAYVGQYSGGTGYGGGSGYGGGTGFGGGDAQSVEVEQSQGLITEADEHHFGF